MEPFDVEEPSEPDVTKPDGTKPDVTKFDEHLGSFTGLYEGFDLDALRDEWERPE